MNELQVFNFEDESVRTLPIEGEPYFVGKDVAKILGYKNGSRDINRHVEEEDRLKYRIGTSGQMREQTIINESGLYALIFGSKLEKAKRFKRWVTSEVLPTIRKHGAYMTPEKLEEALLNPDTLITLAHRLKEEREGRLIAEQQVNELKPKATYYDLVLQNKSLISVTKIAKDYGKSAQWLNNKLHELGIQFKQGDTWFLYQKHAEKGYTQSTTHVIDENKSKMLTKWTQAGRLAIYEWLKDDGILPLIEQEKQEV